MPILKLNNSKTINSIPDKSSSKNLLHAFNFATSTSLVLYKIRITTLCLFIERNMPQKTGVRGIGPKLIHQQALYRVDAPVR